MNAPRGRTTPVRLLLSVFICVHLWLNLSPAVARAAWLEGDWACRRSIDEVWDAEHGNGDELATVEFYSAGHGKPDGSDIRVTTEPGRMVASHLLSAGPGDRVRVVFALQKDVKKYYVYFGNDKAPAPAKEFADVNYQAGLLMEVRQRSGGAVDNFDQMQKSWDRSTTVLGRAMIPAPFLGYNPIGPQEQIIDKCTGSIFAPVDGSYTFAMSVDDRAALYIDGKPLLFAVTGPSDVRYNAKLDLKRGRHDFVLYHVNMAADMRFTVGWKKPNSAQFELINRDALGTFFRGQVGDLEQAHKPVTADFSAEHVGECFFADNYAFRYHFRARSKAPNSPIVKYEWDFGDGQTSTANEVDHVFLGDGIFPIKITVKANAGTDTQTSRFVVGRNWEKITNPPTDDIANVSKIVETYDVSAIPPAQLPRAVWLHQRAGRLTQAVTAAERLAAMKAHPDASVALQALVDLHRDALDQGKIDELVKLWDKTPTDSDLQPWAAKRVGALATWWRPDFAKAAKAVEPFQKDEGSRRLLAQLDVLTGKVDEGRKILEALPVRQADRAAALSGALARSIEFFITERDADAGEDAWDKWQSRYPTDFLEGYSVLLRTKLMEIRKQPAAAAKVAEAFALAVPESSYAPQLLDRASKLLAGIDPAKSQSLRAVLKQKYPEDPLSQN